MSNPYLATSPAHESPPIPEPTTSTSTTVSSGGGEDDDVGWDEEYSVVTDVDLCTRSGGGDGGGGEPALGCILLVV